jgi:CMP-N,N'-diacetyllegionaminic acid synthase
VYVMDHVCFDLDEPADYDYLEYLITSGKIRI